MAHQIFADGPIHFPAAQGLVGIPALQNVVDHFFDRVEIHLWLERIVNTVVTGQKKFVVANRRIVAEMRPASSFDQPVSHQRAGRDDRFHDSRFDQIAKDQTHFADGERAGKSHDHETFFVASHRFQHIGRVANLPAGIGGLSHGPDHVIDGADPGKIERVNRSELVGDGIVQYATRNAFFLCHALASQVG